MIGFSPRSGSGSIVRLHGRKGVPDGKLPAICDELCPTGPHLEAGLNLFLQRKQTAGLTGNLALLQFGFQHAENSTESFQHGQKRAGQ